MTVTNTQFRVEHGLNVIGNANVTGNMAVSGQLDVSGNIIYSGTAVGNNIPNLDDTYYSGRDTQRWIIFGSNGNFSKVLTANTTIPYINGVALGNSTFQWSLFAQSANVAGNVWITSTPIQFNANNTISGNSITLTGHTLVNGDFVMYHTGTGNTAITNLSNNSVYFVISTATNTIKLSSTRGGTEISLSNVAINLADATGHFITRIGVAANSTTLFVSRAVVNVGILRVLDSFTIDPAATFSNTISVTGNATFSSINVSANVTISGNVVIDTDLLYIDSVNNRVGIKNASPSSSAILTFGGNTELSTVNTFHRFNTSNATIIPASVGVTSNSTWGNTKFVVSVWDLTNSSSSSNGGFLIVGANSSATQNLAFISNGSFLYKTGNVVHAGNFGIYDSSGTRLGP